MRQIELILAALLFASSAAHSAPVTWVYEAEVGFLRGSFDFDVAIGDRVTGSITFDADVVVSSYTRTRTELIDSGLQPGSFHPYMNEVSFVATARAVDADSILEITFMVTTADGPVALSSRGGSDGQDELRHSVNEYLLLNDAPDAAFDSFRALSDNEETDELFSLRLMTNNAQSGAFPLEYLLATPPNLDDLFLGRVGYQVGDGTMWAYIERLESSSVP
jgi:hypothetical protein